MNLIHQLTRNPVKTLILANAIVPLFLVVAFRFLRLPMYGQSTIALAFVTLCLIVNLVVFYRVKQMRRVVVVIIGLNLFSFVLAGDISFFTSIPNLPFVIKSLFLLIFMDSNYVVVPPS